MRFTRRHRRFCGLDRVAYKANVPGASGPDGSATKIPQLGAYPGTVLIVLGGYQFIRPTLAGDEYEVAPFTEQDAEVMRSIAATLAFCRGCCVLLPPLAAKFGLDPLFDEITAQIADILAHQGIMYYKPALWNQL